MKCNVWMGCFVAASLVGCTVTEQPGLDESDAAADVSEVGPDSVGPDTEPGDDADAETEVDSGDVPDSEEMDADADAMADADADAMADADAEATADADADAEATADAEAEATADAEAEATADADETAGEEDADDVTIPCLDFAITPPDVALEPLQFTVFTGAGGSGDYRFTLVENESGASIHELLGTFIAGPTSGRVVVRLTDKECGTVDAAVRVTALLELLPRTASIEPARGQLQFEVRGGSGHVRFELSRVGGGTPSSELSATGLLIAGAQTEELLVRLVDMATGREKTASVHVTAGSALAVEPAHLNLPLGESWRLRLTGGSQRVDVRLVAGGSTTPDGQPATEPIVSLENQDIVALRPGRATLRIQDLHTAEVAAFSVDVLESTMLDMHPAGDSKLAGAVLVADLDDDGLPEAIFGMPEADVGAYDSGAVFVHRGIVGGFALEPELVLTVSGRVDELGGALTLGDVDGDGYLDLVVAAALSDTSGVDRGVVQIHRGHPTAFFEETPSTVFTGETNSDQFGGAVALCDFNGDGRLDLAMTARFAEDENQSPVAANAGAVYIHLGYLTGFQRSADQIVWGAVPRADGTNPPLTNLNLGRAVAVGDVDADGLCDLAVSSIAYSTGAGRSSDGLVMVYRGRGPDSFGPGGLQSRPSLVIAGDEPDAAGQLGTSIAMGDIDGDGRADLVVGQPEITRRVGASTRTSNGSVTIWSGVEVPTDGTRLASVLEAPGRYFGRDVVNEAGDRYGYAVAVGDFDGVPPLDVFVNGRLDELAPQCSSNCGTVHVLRGVQGAWPALLAPAHVYPGDRADQNFASLFAVAPDLDGDALAELVVRIPTDNRLAPRIGFHALRASVVETPLAELAFPYESAGSRYGSALAVLPDLDGDGFAELAVGAWRSQFDPLPTGQHRPGEVALYRGSATGVVGQPFQRIGGFTGHTSGDVFGHALAPVDDVDGDGMPELAVVARAEDTGNQCSPARSDGGSVYLFETVEAGGGVANTPMAVLHGPQASQQIHAVLGADVNGDGFADVVVGGTAWDRPTATGGTADNGGGAGIFLGGPSWSSANLVVKCAADVLLFGPAAGDVLGTALESLGDLNGDGCEDIAVGAPTADPPGSSNAGIVYLVWGFGQGCDFESAHRTALSPSNLGAQAGGALAAADLDGDGYRELAIGGRRWSNGVEAVGAVWMASGAYLRTLAASAAPWVDSVAPTPVFNVAASGQLPARIVGIRRDEDFGAALSLVAGTGFENGWLVVGRPLSDMPGVDGAGAVTVHEVRLAGGVFSFVAVPPVAIGGETRRSRSELGRNLIAWRSSAGRVIAAGAGLSSGVGLDDGAVFVTRPR